MAKARELRDRRQSLLEIAKNIVETAEREERGMRSSEESKYDVLIDQADDLQLQIDELENAYPRQARSFENASTRSRGIMGDSEARAIMAYVRGDRAALRDLDPSGDEFDIKISLETRANDTTMNITTPADGGSAVPTGFAGRVASRMNAIRLSGKLGVQVVPGKGTTVNYPYENADPSEFATTAEQNDAHENNYERDAPTLGSKAFTLVKKTKKLELTEELLDDEDVNVMAYIGNHIGRSMGLTHNSMLLTEVASNGTALKIFAGASAIAEGEPDDLVFNDTLGYYLDDGGSIGWVMRPSTHGAITGLSGESRIYDKTPQGGGRELLNYPVHYSNAAAAIGASGKSVYFGNWFYVGMREDPALRLVRDPYSVDGMVILKYSFRTVYGVLIAGAVGYGAHPTA